MYFTHNYVNIKKQINKYIDNCLTGRLVVNIHILFVIFVTVWSKIHVAFLKKEVNSVTDYPD